MDQQDKIYLWLSLITTVAFGAAILFGVLKILEYKEPVASSTGLF